MRLVILLALCGASLTCADDRRQISAPGGPASALSVVVEQRDDTGVHAVAQKHVFKRGDLIHLRIKVDRPGFLYAVNRSSSGTTAFLYPEPAEATNRIESGRTYLIPADPSRWLRVENPPGYDIVYLVVSSVPLEVGPPKKSVPEPRQPQPRPSVALVPRCDDDYMRSRGECTDLDAGVAHLQEQESLPAPIEDSAKTASRDIVIKEDNRSVVVSPARKEDTTIVYKLKIAHQ